MSADDLRLGVKDAAVLLSPHAVNKSLRLQNSSVTCHTSNNIILHHAEQFSPHNIAQPQNPIILPAAPCSCVYQSIKKVEANER